MSFDRRLLSFTAGLRWRIALAALFGLVAVPIAIWRLMLLGDVIAQVFQGETLAALAGALTLIAGLLLLRVGLDFAKEQVADVTATRVKVRVRRMIVEHALRLGPGHFDQRRTGDAVLKLVESVERLTVFFGLYLPQLIVAAVTPVLIFAFVAILDIQTALIYLVCAVVTLVVPWLFHRFYASSSATWIETYSALGAESLDAVQALPTLKAFGQSRQRGVLLGERTQRLYHDTMSVIGADIMIGRASILAISTGTAIALAWGAVRVQSGDLDLRTLLILLLLGVEVFRPLRETVRLYHSGMWALAGAKGIFDLLDTRPEVGEGGSAETSRGAGDSASPPGRPSLPPTARFERVTFGYQRGRRPALDDLTFDLRAGETVGVVGSSGAGKSTLVNLLLRFSDPQQGRVLVGDRDIRTVPLDLLRSQVAVVAQDTYLFHGTVAENLRLGKPDATPAELEAACIAANAHPFITALPQGYETLVGERGSRLSGGQRQRIAIARALLKDAPILVLDEATSSVDAENEAAIQEALGRLQRGRTTLVIAHRLSSVASADRIVVLDRGRLVEQGTHSELLAAGGQYARLMAAQQPVEEERQRENRAVVSAAAAVPASTPAPVQAEDLPQAGPPIPAMQVWTRLLQLTGPRGWEMALGFVAGILHAGAGIAVAVVGALLVGRVFTGEPIGSLVVALLILGPLTAVLGGVESWVSHDLAFRLLTEMRDRLYRALDPLAPAYLLRRRSGDIVSLVSGDIETLELFYAHSIVPALSAVCVPVGVLLVLGTISWPLALALAPFIVVVALTPLVAGRLMAGVGAELREQFGTMNAIMVDSIQGMSTLLTFGRGATRADEIEDQGWRLADLQIRFFRDQSMQRATIELMSGLGSLAVLTVGAGLVSSGELARAQLPLVAVLAVAAFAPVAELVTTFKQLSETLASARRYFAIEDEPVPVRDGPGVSLATEHELRTDPAMGPSPTALPSGLPFAFEGVTFRYDTGRPPALADVSFTASAGQTVALVGRSGAGKTTAAHLLLRFWDPQSGRITLAGRNLRDFTLDDLRGHIGLVAQETYLFNTSLLENLRLGRPDATDEEVTAAARAANVHEFAEALPDGYLTTVGERGVQMSGGQRQRVAIARALLKDAPVLVLDEATSHLDAANEAEVREALDRLKAGRTTLVIAHRLSTIRDTDLIVVLDSGRVAEHGTHAELLALDGFYSHLIAAQMAAYGRSGQASSTASAREMGV